MNISKQIIRWLLVAGVLVIAVCLLFPRGTESADDEPDLPIRFSIPPQPVPLPVRENWEYGSLIRVASSGDDDPIIAWSTAKGATHAENLEELYTKIGGRRKVTTGIRLKIYNILGSQGWEFIFDDTGTDNTVGVLDFIAIFKRRIK